MGKRRVVLLPLRKNFSPAEYAERSDQIALSVAGRYARGSVATQNGGLLTEERLDRERVLRRAKIQSR